MCRWYQELKCCCSGSETPGAGVVGEGPGQEGRHMKRCKTYRMTTIFREFLSGTLPMSRKKWPKHVAC